MSARAAPAEALFFSAPARYANATKAAPEATAARQDLRTCVSTCQRCRWRSGSRDAAGPILALLAHYREVHGGIPAMEVR